MAAANSADGKLVVLRSGTKDIELHSNVTNGSGANLQPPLPLPLPSPLPPPLSTTAPSTDTSTTRTEVIIPTRRVVVIRNTKLPNIDPSSNDAGESGKSNSSETAPIMNDGSKSVYLIRRPIPPDSFKILKLHKPDQEPQPNIVSEPTQLSTALSTTDDVISSIELARSPSPLEGLPIVPIETQLPVSSLPTEYVPRYAPYLRQSRSKVRTPTPSHMNSSYQSPSITRVRSSTTKTDEFQVQPSSTLTLESERLETQSYSTSLTRNIRNKKNTSARTASAKSIVFVNPDDQSMAVIENSFIKAEKSKSQIKQTKFVKKSQSSSANESQSREKLVETTNSSSCLDCFARHMCLFIILCLILILIGLAGVGVSVYFLVTNSDPSIDTTPMIVGIAIGAALALFALCFLCIILGCLGARDGYFTYDESDKQQVTGRALAIIPPTHPNAHLYIPHEAMKASENHQGLPVMVKSNRPSSTMLQRQTSLRRPLSNTKPHALPQTIFESSTTSNRRESRPKKANLTIEVPERLFPARNMSPKTRERSLTQVIQNINHIYDDLKRQYNGGLSNKVIVTVDKNAP